MIYLCRGDDIWTSVLNRCGVTSLGQRCTVIVRHISVMENGGEFHAYYTYVSPEIFQIIY